MTLQGLKYLKATALSTPLHEFLYCSDLLHLSYSFVFIGGGYGNPMQLKPNFWRKRDIFSVSYQIAQIIHPPLAAALEIPFHARVRAASNVHGCGSHSKEVSSWLMGGSDHFTRCGV
jgi:hypothetical protein